MGSTNAKARVNGTKASDTTESASTQAECLAPEEQAPEDDQAPENDQAPEDEDAVRSYVVLIGFIDKETGDDLDVGQVIERTATRAAEVNGTIPGALIEVVR